MSVSMILVVSEIFTQNLILTGKVGSGAAYRVFFCIYP
jgi:hypothetical protein